MAGNEIVNSGMLEVFLKLHTSTGLCSTSNSAMLSYCSRSWGRVPGKDE